MLNKKGFTLVELVIVVIILGVILAFALPNITSTLERNKKDQMIIDAKDMVEKAKNYALKTNGYPIDDEDDSTADCKSFTLNDIDPRNEIKESPFGSDYITDSFVKICLESSKYIYYIRLKDLVGNSIGIIDETGNTIDGIDYMKLNESNKYKLVKIS